MDGEKETFNSPTKDTSVDLPDSKAKQGDSPMDIDPPQEKKPETVDRTENGKDSGLESGSGDGTSTEEKAENASVEQSEEKKQKLDTSGNSSETKTETAEDATPKETVTFKVMFNKQKYDVTFDLDGTVSGLKGHIQTVTGVPSAMQKLMFKGLLKDDKTLRELKVTKGAKFMLVGSKLDDVLEVNKPVDKKALAEEEKKGATKEPFCKMKLHKKILDKGVPDDAMPGIKGVQERLPSVPVSGMVNKANSKVRLTFKLELDQIWIGTKERTEKLPMNSVKAVVSEPIEGHEEYHIMAIQLGPTEASRYWIYWVPAQYVNAIKDTILASGST
ncbi:hypothetical protein BSL78_10502, partial [Apostichopus japonicus]